MVNRDEVGTARHDGGRQGARDLRLGRLRDLRQPVGAGPDRVPAEPQRKARAARASWPAPSCPCAASPRPGCRSPCRAARCSQPDAAEPTAAVVVGVGRPRPDRRPGPGHPQRRRLVRAEPEAGQGHRDRHRQPHPGRRRRTTKASPPPPPRTPRPPPRPSCRPGSRIIVEGVVGAGAARVQVTADIDHSRSTTQEQKYDPDGQVVRSTSTNGSEVPGHHGHSPTAAPRRPTTSPAARRRSTRPPARRDTANTETTNYEISNTTTTTIKEPGEVKKLAVAVAVDGKLTPAADGKGEPTYAPRTAEEIDPDRGPGEGGRRLSTPTRGDQVKVTNVRFNRDAPARPAARTAARRCSTSTRTTSCAASSCWCCWSPACC